MTTPSDARPTVFLLKKKKQYYDVFEHSEGVKFVLLQEEEMECTKGRGRGRKRNEHFFLNGI